MENVRNVQTVVLACVLSAAISFGIARTTSNTPAQTAASESMLDRIMESKTLRCGYVPYNPMIIKDAKTGDISGIGADIHQYIADVLGVKLVRTAEASWPTYIEDLRVGRYDMICDMDVWLPGYSSKLAVNLPILYTTISAWARPENAERFLNKPSEQFNSPDVTISAVDGTMPMVIAQKDFPNAKLLGMANMTDYTLNILNVVDKKADVTFVENVFAEMFLKTHPGELVNVTPNTPLRTYAWSIPTLTGDIKMKTVLEAIIGYMIDNGEVDKILHKYGVEKGLYVAEHPYRAVK